MLDIYQRRKFQGIILTITPMFDYIYHDCLRLTGFYTLIVILWCDRVYGHY